MASKSILCPYCFETFKNTDALYQCESDERNPDGSLRCERVPSGEYDQYWGVAGNLIRYNWPQKSGFMSKLFGPKLEASKCPQCGYLSRRFICPKCHNWIPEEMVKNGAQIISVIGSPSSGKTNYIVSLIHELTNYGYMMDLLVHPTQIYRDGYKEESTQNRFINFERQLFKEKTVLNKTQVDAKDIPWIFHLYQQHTNQHIYLVFYDTAGEQFNDAKKIKDNVKYLQESDGIIILLDTLAIEKVEKILTAEGLVNLGGKTKDGLKNIFTSLFNIENKESIYKKPTAFVFSKFDAVLDHSDKFDINLQAFKPGNKRENSSYLNTGKVDFDKIDDISDALEDVLIGLGVGNLLGDFSPWKGSGNGSKKNNSESNYKLFGVSALGCMPDEALQLKEVKPYRVMDPLMWVLKKLGQFDIPSIPSKE